MVNSSKTPTGKAKKGQVSVREDSGTIKACFPRTHFANDKQVKLGTGISLVDGWETTASKLQRRLQIELEDGKLGNPDGTFNLDRYREILEEYGLRAKLRLVKTTTLTSDDQLPPKPELSILEVWDMYCEYKKHKLAETTYELKFKGTFLNAIKDAIKAVGENAISIRNWLIANRCKSEVKKILSHLSHSYVLAIRQKITNFNPFDGMHEEIETRQRKKIIDQKDDDSDDSDILNPAKSYNWDEVQIILDYVKSNCPHWHNYLKFKFLTGCRTGEGIGLWWRDVKWDDECIVIQRTYSYGLKIFKPTKNETKRLFPMPRDGELWNLLKSIPQGEPNEVVFKSKQGKTINARGCLSAWSSNNNQKGIIPALINQGKLTKYLPPYNTRHTFINHQINDIGIKESIVNAWCEHSEETSKKHYRDLDLRIIPGYGESIVKQQSEVESPKQVIESLQEQLRQQQELINKLLQDRDNLKS